jgi:hypothetical protein
MDEESERRGTENNASSLVKDNLEKLDSQKTRSASIRKTERKGQLCKTS